MTDPVREALAELVACMEADPVRELHMTTPGYRWYDAWAAARAALAREPAPRLVATPAGYAEPWQIGEDAAPPADDLVRKSETELVHSEYVAETTAEIMRLKAALAARDQRLAALEGERDRLSRLHTHAIVMVASAEARAEALQAEVAQMRQRIEYQAQQVRDFGARAEAAERRAAAAEGVIAAADAMARYFTPPRSPELVLLVKRFDAARAEYAAITAQAGKK